MNDTKRWWIVEFENFPSRVFESEQVAKDNAIGSLRIVEVAEVKPPIRCIRCNGLATRKMVPDNIQLPEGNPGCELCEACIQYHVWQAEEVNEHEMRNFGGAWGLVTYHFEPL